ncbi:hypothetical protein [Nocardiopsis lucentensis]|uniref:hypothetical protein n=1 Tax=Nocardiopsis lucentensis TaxID=53441 RepID=UPI00034A13FD|nr:hypothetical protein [Nocardiopsis lucentensis]
MNGNPGNPTDPKIRFAEINPVVAESFPVVFRPCIEDFDEEADGFYEHDADRRHLNLPP